MAFELRLDRLELTNYRKFERYSIDFDERLTVLVGDNGSGKSSILAASAVAVGTFLYALAYAHQSNISGADARICAREMGGVTDRQEQYPVVVSARGFVGEGEGNALEWSRSLQFPDGDMTHQDAQQLISLSRACAQRVKDGDSELILPVIACYGTNRLWTKNGPRDRRRKAFSRQDGYDHALDAGVSEDQMLTWFFKMTAQDLQRSQSLKPMEANPLFASVRRAVEKCFARVTGCDEVNVTYNLDADDLVIEYIESDRSVRRLPFAQLSDGYRVMLSMVADIAYRMALLNPALEDRVLSETAGVVLIDEVDLHLHPVWQARVLGDLTHLFPKVQFIVTTHAPVVISSVHARQVRVLGEGDSAHAPSGEIYGSDAGRVLVSVMGASERPEEVQEDFDKFYQALDAGDLEGSRKRLEQIEEKIGPDDTELVGARTALSLEEAEARYAAD